MVRTGRPACGRILSWSDWTPYAPVATALTAWQARSGRRGKAAGFTHRLAALLCGTAMVTALCRSIVKVLKTNPRRRILAWSDRGVHALSPLRFDTPRQCSLNPKPASYGEKAKPSVFIPAALLCVPRFLPQGVASIFQMAARFVSMHQRSTRDITPYRLLRAHLRCRPSC